MQGGIERVSDWISRWGYGALFALVFAEEAGVPLPVPGDVVVALMGILARHGGASFPLVLVVSVVAAVGGASVLFGISRRAGRPLFLRFAGRFGLSPERAARLEAWQKRHGAVAVVAIRLVPGLRIVATVAAGALGLDRARFTAGAVVAAAIWASGFFWIGYAFGAPFEALARRAEVHVLWFAIPAAILLALALVVRRLLHARHVRRARAS